jgi:four helix bundle protein
VALGSFKQLRVYVLAAELADDVRLSALAWSSFDRWTLGLQFVRAADSIGANIAEASGRWHYADRRRFLYMARGSLAETSHWALRAKARGLTVPAVLDDRTDEIGRLLNGLISSTLPTTP